MGLLFGLWVLSLPLPLSWTLETLAEGVCRQNKELAAARWVIESVKGRSQQAGKLTNPRMITSSGINTINPENMQGFSLQQSFPITARLRLEKKVASLDIQQAEKEVQWMAHQKVMEAMETATRWLALRERQQILKEQITLAQGLYATLKEQQQEVSDPHWIFPLQPSKSKNSNSSDQTWNHPSSPWRTRCVPCWVSRPRSLFGWKRSGSP